MKILHIITNTELGGAQSVCISLANRAVQEGNTVAVASMPGGYLWDNLDKSVIPLAIKSMIKPISIGTDFRCYLELKNTIAGFDPDIIHLHSSKAGVLGRLAGKKYRKKIVYTVHGFDSIRLQHRIFLPLERLLQKSCGAIVAVSHYDELMLRKEGITHNLNVIHNGIVVNDIHFKKPFDSSGYKKVIMTIARIAYPKKLESFLAIASASAMKEYLFVWVGGSAEKSMEEIKKEYSIPSNVLLLGDYPNAPALLKYCDLFVLFSNYEGLPMTIIEAMAHKKPIVSSNVGGIPELVDEGNGVLVNSEDEAVTAIHELLNDDAKLYNMGMSLFDKYLECFTLDGMWAEYRDLYRTLADAIL